MRVILLLILCGIYFLLLVILIHCTFQLLIQFSFSIEVILSGWNFVDSEPMVNNILTRFWIIIFVLLVLD